MVSPMPMEVASTDTQLSTEDTPMEDITMESVMLRPSLMLTSMAATDTPMEVSTAHMFTMASVMLRPNPTHGAMVSVASTDTQLSTEDTPTEDITMESAMLRPNPMLTFTALTDTPMVVSTPTVSPMVDTSDKKELHSSGLNCNAFKQICLRKIIQLTYS